jgi:hypothetical protein
MESHNVSTPKVFISYCWTSPEHQERVRELANRLRGDGVDVILDIYELREGQDKHAYMERMVTDPDISKVMVISNRKYAEKADAREGGVGIESTIISQEIYSQVEQMKFIPLVTELDEEGRPYLPTFMRGRIYLDFSSEEKQAANYEHLLRNIFDKPLYQKPAVGQRPSFLLEDGPAITKTGFKLQMLKDAILKNRPTVRGLTADYLKSFQSCFEDFKLTTADYDVRALLIEKVRSNVRRFLPYRDEFIELMSFLSLYIDDEAVYQSIFRFFEGLSIYRDPPRGVSGYESLTDHFRFILHEMFLYAIAALIKNEKFSSANIFLTQEYFNRSGRTDYVNYEDFTVFSYQEAVTIEFENNQTLGGGWTRLLKERATNEELNLRTLQEADFILFLRSSLAYKGDFYPIWHPKTLVGTYHFDVFEIFARAESHRYFESIKPLLGVESKEDFVTKLNTLIERSPFRTLNTRSMNLRTMANVENLDTRA